MHKNTLEHLLKKISYSASPFNVLSHPSDILGHYNDILGFGQATF